MDNSSIPGDTQSADVDCKQVEVIESEVSSNAQTTEMMPQIIEPQTTCEKTMPELTPIVQHTEGDQNLVHSEEIIEEAIENKEYVEEGVVDTNKQTDEHLEANASLTIDEECESTIATIVEEHVPIIEARVATIEEQVATLEENVVEEHITGSDDVIMSEEIIEEATETIETENQKMDTSAENEEELEKQGHAVIEEQVVFNNEMQVDEEIHNGNEEVETTDVEESESADKEIMVKSIVVTSEDGEESTVTVQEVRDEVTGEIYYVEAVVVDEDGDGDGDGEEEYLEESVQIVEEPRKTINIPSHVLGRNIINPSIDPFRNGKAPPKPRLGVKIPYRNLTSQIVSKQEIADEILERSRRNRELVGGQNLFAKKLTQALAKKIAPSKKSRTSTSAGTHNKDDKDEKINNTDLLAILEGDDDEDEEKKQSAQVPVSKPEPVEVKEMSKEMERELALKQLSELPEDVPTISHRGGKSKGDARRAMRSAPKPKIVEPVVVETIEEIVPEKIIIKVEEAPVSAASNNRKSKRGRDNANEDEEELPNRFSANVPIKTYTRKLKTSDELVSTDKPPISVVQSVTPESTKKIDLPQGSTTKRIIKKKVIWDPDEATPRKVSKSEEKSTETRVKDPTTKERKSDKLDVKDTKKADSEVEEEEDDEEEEKEIKVDKKETLKVEKIVKPEKKIVAEVEKVDKTPKIDKKIQPEIKKAKLSSDTPQKASKIVEAELVTKIEKKVTESPKIEKKPIETPKIEKRGPGRPRLTSIVAKNNALAKIKTPVKSKALMDSPKNESSPSPKTATLLYKKRLTEIDKLLMDEGAANMLYSLKNTEEDQDVKKPNKSLVTKTNELLNDLQQIDKVSPKALRKKEAANLMKSPQKITPINTTPSAISRQKSRDSNRSSLQSPPPSPNPMLTADASRIIRRHSSSSYSSMDEDETEKNKEKSTETTKIKKPSEVKAGRRKADSSSENPKKKIKKELNEAAKKELNEEMSKNFNKLVEKEVDVGKKYEKFKTFEVKSMDKLTQIILTPTSDNNVYVTAEMMQELGSKLKELESNDDCSVVVISSSGTAFCNGLNFKALIAQTAKKSTAKKFALNIRDFLLNIAKFPKILIAGVHGDVVGLGVTMLPLFDMVVASDSATFSTPYARLGCIAEGGSLLSLPHLSQKVLVSELLISSRKLIAAEAQRLGLVTKVLWPDKFQEELQALSKMISKQSTQFMEATKKQLRVQALSDITTALNSETDTLVQHWTSSECQKNFSQG